MSPSRLVLWVFSFLLAFSVMAAHQLDSVTKDPTGSAVIQRTLSAMGSSSTISDTVCTGTLTLARFPGDSLTVVFKSKGTQMTRTESTGPKGTTVRVVNNGIGVIISPNGSVRRLNMNNTIAERVQHIPSLSLLSEALGPSVEIESLSDVQFDGAPHHVVALSYTPDPAYPQTRAFLDITRRLIFVNSNTGLVSKTEFTRFPESGHHNQRVERQFSDYRLVGSVLVPFQQVTYSDGQLESTLRLTSAQVNLGLQDAEFAIPE
jgi:hypothetical protein